MIAGLDHVAIKVSDGERSSRFYREVLGATVEELPYGRLRFRVAGVAIHVHTPTSTPHPLPLHVPGPGSADVCFVWSGTPAAAVEHLRAHGVEPIEGPVERAGSAGPGQSVYFRDPDGALLELIAYA